MRRWTSTSDPKGHLRQTLAQQLHARHLLVVLDNCEHLVEACTELVGGLSAACPHLHVLATSRVPLGVEGEATFEVTGLPVPGPDASSASTVAATDAARLSEVRARQVAAGFRIGDGNASAVVEILEAVSTNAQRRNPDDESWSGQKSPPRRDWGTVPWRSGRAYGDEQRGCARTHRRRAFAETAWGHLSAGQLLDRLEWAYGETGGFEPEVVWELARRVIDQG